MKNKNESIIKLGKWFMDNEIKFELDTKFYGDEVVKVIKVKAKDMECGNKKVDLHFILSETCRTEILVGEWNE